MKEKKLSLGKIAEIIFKILLVVLVIALPYVFGFWAYTFLTGFFTFLPQLTFLAVCPCNNSNWICNKSF